MLHHLLSPPPPPQPAPLRRQLPPLLPSAAILCRPVSTARAAIVSGDFRGGGSRDEEAIGVRENELVEVGYVSSAHGLRGELRVMPSTDFPELRFSEPGKRWLKTRISGKEVISEVELIEGRGHHAQKSWIVCFDGIDTVDKAKQIVGSKVLVRIEDRPELEEGEFYTPDLVGMQVFLKETGRFLGVVTNVFNHGAGDLLQVRLGSNGDEKSNLSIVSDIDVNHVGQHIWVPFVEAIVPDVDISKREMHVTPPKGLLELNLRSDTRSKKERRQQEWRERRRLKQRLIVAKKRLSEIGQKHILEGLSLGEKDQKNFLERQIASLDLKMFQHALLSVNRPPFRDDFSEFMNSSSDKFSKSAITISYHDIIGCVSEREKDVNYPTHKEGKQIHSTSKAAIVIFIDSEKRFERVSNTNGGSKSSAFYFKESLHACSRHVQVEEQGIEAPLVVVSPAHEVQAYKEYLAENDYFGFNSQKVWVLEEAKLPVVSTSINCSSNKILLKSPWELLEAPVGPGGLFSLLSSHGIIDTFNEMGIEYMQVCSLSDRSLLGHPLFFGLVSTLGADIGIKIFKSHNNQFDMIFSMRHVNKIAKLTDEIQFYPILEQHEHIELVEKKAITIFPNVPNSYRFHCPIYSFINSSLSEICIMEVLD